MAGFQDLPHECVLMIVSYLRDCHIEQLAKTFNKRLMEACLPLLALRIQTARNDSAMRQLFGPPELWYITDPIIDLSIVEANEISHPEDLSQALDYLPHDLSWLTQLDPYTQKEWFGYKPTDVEPEDVRDLYTATRELGIHYAIPQAFWTFINDFELQERVPSGRGCYFILSQPTRMLNHQLVELFKSQRPDFDKEDLNKLQQHKLTETRAYVFNIYSDQQGCGYWHLYVDTDGNHAVLASPWEILSSYDREEDNDNLQEHKTLTEVEQRLKIQILPNYHMSNFSLEATSFQDWLAFTYFQGRVQMLAGRAYEGSRLQKHGDVLVETWTVPEEVSTFVTNVYTQQGRKQQRLS